MNARTCPKCGCYKSSVKDVRDKDIGTYRKRVCPMCGHKWQTVEVERWHYESMLKEASK
jgi:transcriptional regulator NrdR family protein